MTVIEFFENQTETSKFGEIMDSYKSMISQAHLQA